MNFIKNMKITASIFFAAILSISSSANAATVDMDGSGAITGISGIFVDGYGTYDATFNQDWQTDTYEWDFIIATGDSMMNLFTSGGELQGSDADFIPDLGVGCTLSTLCIGFTVAQVNLDVDGTAFLGFDGGGFLNYSEAAGDVDTLDALYGIGYVGDVAAQDAAGTFVSWNQVSPVPEPSTLALMLAGFGLIGFKSHRRNKLSA